jgi:hypothetical protein
MMMVWRLPAPSETETLASMVRAAKQKEQAEDQHLRSTQAVTGYYIGANDGKIGHGEDFIVDDEIWSIRYIVVDTRNWWPGQKVLVSPQWIEKVSWADSMVYVGLTRGAIKNAPEYDASSPIDRDYEARLHEALRRGKATGPMERLEKLLRKGHSWFFVSQRAHVKLELPRVSSKE